MLDRASLFQNNNVFNQNKHHSAEFIFYCQRNLYNIIKSEK